MNPYYLNFTPGSQASGGGYVQTAQSIGQDSRAPSTLQESTPEHLPIAPQHSYILSHDGYEPFQAPQIPRGNSPRSFHLSVGSEFIKAPSSLSSHPYNQARMRHTSSRASAQYQGWSQLPFLAAPNPAPAPGIVSPYNAVIARKFAPAATISSVLQPDIPAPNANQDMLSFIGSLAVPGQTFLPTHKTPTLPPCTFADEADIEYAQYRYGKIRCFYQCRFDLSGSPCNKWIVGDRIRVLRHLRDRHHLQTGPAKPAFCRWDGCTHSRPMKQENLSRHIVMHLGVKWKCPHCRRLFSRDDAVHRHIERTVPGMDATDAEVIPGYEARVA